MQGIIPMKHERKIFDMLIQASLDSVIKEGEVMCHAGLILGLCRANERRRYFVTTSLIGWAQT